VDRRANDGPLGQSHTGWRTGDNHCIFRWPAPWQCPCSQASQEEEWNSSCTYRPWLVYRGIRKVG
jgi:hypothetical protein